MTGVRIKETDRYGRVNPVKHNRMPLPPKGKVYRYILTCAQNNTHVHDGFWSALQRCAEHYKAQIFVSRFHYFKTGIGAIGDKAQIVDKGTMYEQTSGMWWEPCLTPYLMDKHVELAPGLVWCGELSISPTMKRPLNGQETYTKGRSCIFPHTKIEMKSVPVKRSQEEKHLYTTGAVTKRNYIHRRVGFQAMFNHAYGALLVEVDSNGDWWSRQLNADNSGTFDDLLMRFSRNKTKKTKRVEAINWGDIHVPFTSPIVIENCWKPGTMLDQLRPRYQFAHDTWDFYARNHHERDNFHKRFKRFVSGHEDVRAETRAGFDTLAYLSRKWSEVVVVASNHDEAIYRWLNEVDYRDDLVNAEFFLDCQIRILRAMRLGDDRYCLLEDLSREMLPKTAGDITFLRTDDEFAICETEGRDGIECGMHSHLGANGARGSATGMAKVGFRSNIGHSHSPCIIDGVYQAGTSSKKDMSYVKGLSSWSWTHTVTYETSKRCQITIRESGWRARGEAAWPPGAVLPVTKESNKASMEVLRGTGRKLTRAQVECITTGLEAGKGYAEIARELRVHRSTVMRAVRRMRP